jgi:molecular chaperone Hsp33
MMTNINLVHRDILHRFLIEDSDVRGECVHLDATWRAIQDNNDYPSAVRKVLGEAVTALTLLAATIKFDGSISLQITGDGPLYLLIAHCTSDGTVRGLARWRGDTSGCSFEQLMGSAILVMTVDPGAGKERYQGIVPVNKDGLSAVLQEYFDRSEQLPTRLWLAADDNALAGLLLQKMPDRQAPDESWTHITDATAEVTTEQLLGLPIERLLTDLYGNGTVRLFTGKTLRYGCHCSRDRAEDTVRSLGQKEFSNEIRAQTPVQVDCEFCNQRYEFDAVDLALLFAGEPTGNLDEVRH